ncbi:hypothetical protein IEQ34_011338 [Dendrobium chrysotoxum]|uniref:Uncharacterized protein n=1 Tax=Dendrobium chrysotoxum TaxID=161865 RepID=A0AAV7GX87_DENCH|nr:hypothetical protein IEQ34_011338 [Dendrobium chrysotoxum]
MDSSEAFIISIDGKSYRIPEELSLPLINQFKPNLDHDIPSSLRSSARFSVIWELTGSGHDHNLAMSFGCKPPSSEGPGHNRLPTVPFGSKTAGPLFTRKYGSLPASPPFRRNLRVIAFPSTLCERFRSYRSSWESGNPYMREKQCPPAVGSIRARGLKSLGESNVPTISRRKRPGSWSYGSSWESENPYVRSYGSSWESGNPYVREKQYPPATGSIRARGLKSLGTKTRTRVLTIAPNMLQRACIGPTRLATSAAPDPLPPRYKECVYEVPRCAVSAESRV